MPTQMPQDVLGELFAKTTTAMLLADDERRYVAANEAACEALGIELDDLLAMRIEDLASPEFREVIADQWTAFIEAGSQSGPYRLETPAGTTLDVIYSATANVVPGLHLSVFISPELAEPELDLSPEAVEAEERASVDPREILNLIFQNASTAMLVVDDERRFVAANPAFFTLMETTVETVGSMRLEDVLPESISKDVEERFARFLSDGSQWGPAHLTTLAGNDLAVVYSGTANILPGRHLIELLHRSSSEPAFNFNPKRVLDNQDGRTLTPREREVLSLLALGETNQSIASTLHLSAETVRNHTRSARQKLGAKSRSHAIAIAVQTGQLELGPDGQS